MEQQLANGAAHTGAAVRLDATEQLAVDADVCGCVFRHAADYTMKSPWLKAASMARAAVSVPPRALQLLSPYCGLGVKRLVGEQLPRKPASVRQVEIDRPDSIAHARLGNAAGLRLLIAGMRHGNLRQTVPQGSMRRADPAVVDDAGQPWHDGIEIDPAVRLGSGGKAGRRLIGASLACAPARHYQRASPLRA